MQTSRRVIAAAVDGDGCGYHSDTDALIIWLCAKCGELFVTAMASGGHSITPDLLQSMKKQLLAFHKDDDFANRKKNVGRAERKDSRKRKKAQFKTFRQ